MGSRLKVAVGSEHPFPIDLTVTLPWFIDASSWRQDDDSRATEVAQHEPEARLPDLPRGAGPAVGYAAREPHGSNDVGQQWLTHPLYQTMQAVSIPKFGLSAILMNPDLSFCVIQITIGKEGALRWLSIQGSRQAHSERAQTS